MMTPISSNASQVRLNMDRLKAVRERLQQTQATPNNDFQKNLAQTEATPSPALDASIQPSKFEVDTPSSTSSSAISPTILPNPLVMPLEQEGIPQPTLKEVSTPKAKPLPIPMGRFGLPVNDIQQIAEQAGFISVDQSAIERAYATRKSLFVDVKI
jgi:hypothetical protein